MKKKSSVEQRTFPLAEIRADAGEGKMPRIVGHAAVFNSRTELYPGFFEIVAPGAFRKTLAEADIRALFNHDANIVLGRNKAGTLDLKEDERGLAIDAQPPDTQTVRDLVMEPMRRGDVDQMSFAFRIVKDRWEEDYAAKTLTRTLLEVRLYEVSVVTFAAYPQTDASLRSLEGVESPIDFYAVARAMAKLEHGLTLTQEERAAITASIETLQRSLQAAPDAIANHSATSVEPCQSVATLLEAIRNDKLR